MAYKRKWFLGFLVLIVIMLGGFIGWAETPSGPAPEAIAALNSDTEVQVDNGQWLVFTPAQGSPQTGFIFYPGGRVDYRSYAPQAEAIAARGYLVVIPRMPLNLAVFDSDAAADVIAAHPDIQQWVVGGHSLGGSMAANFAAKHPQDVEGLVLWASYPASSDDLSAQDLIVTSIYGSNDGVADLDTVRAASALLPADTTWVEITGGNHAQFGWYGPQGGDHPASIDPFVQQEQTVNATVALLEHIEKLS